jgi:hypothetical protein
MAKLYKWIPTVTKTGVMHPSKRWYLDVYADGGTYRVTPFRSVGRDAGYSFILDDQRYGSIPAEVRGTASNLADAESMAEEICLVFMKRWDAIIEQEKQLELEAHEADRRAHEAAGGLSVAPESPRGFLSVFK